MSFTSAAFIVFPVNIAMSVHIDVCTGFYVLLPVMILFVVRLFGFFLIHNAPQRLNRNRSLLVLLNVWNRRCY